MHTSGRRYLCIAIAAVLLLISAAAWGQPAAPQNAAANNRVAGIFYDGPADPSGKAYLHALYLQNLLGHFEYKAELVPMAQYRAGQLARYASGFFIGAKQGTEIPKAFLADVRSYAQPFCWMGQHIGTLVNDSRSRFGFRFEQYSETLGFKSVYYKDTLLPKEEPDLNIVSVTDPASVEVVSTAVNGRKSWHPYAIRQKNFWYFADTPFSYMSEGGRYLVICDLLHDILGIQHKSDNRALVRIEDVSIEDDPSDLREIADLLGGHRVPFQISLIPIFRNPSQGSEVRISDRRSFADALRYMIARGGTPVMHGITHQYRGISADDYEFWDESRDRPVIGDSAELVSRKLQLGFAECFSAGVFPVAFETPHYAASETDYRALTSAFTLFNDRTMAAPRVESQQFFPYPLTDRFGRYIVPEDLGYISAENPDPKAILEAARNLRVVRDGIASLFFHPFLDAGMLDQLVRGISGLGYRFVSLREFGPGVDYQGRFIVRTQSGRVTLLPRDEFWRLRAFDANGRLLRTEISSAKTTGSVEVGVDVPRGGWVALDCLKNPPAKERQPDWKARLKDWWNGFFSEREKETAGTHAGSFSGGRTAYVLAVDRPDAAARNNQRSYQTVLETFGYRMEAVRATAFNTTPDAHNTLLVIPQAAGAKLTPAQQQSVIAYLEAGGGVVADGKQPWLSQLGLTGSGHAITVSSVSDELYPEMGLQWRPQEQVERFTVPEKSRELMIDTESGQPLALTLEHGAGRLLYLAVPFDPHTADGTSHFPYFPKYLSETFGAGTPLRSPKLEAYFDPSYRMGADLNRLAASWRRSGVRTLYVAAWLFSRTYSYPYADLIAACHRQGISVYAWFVFPAVTQKMWDEHPDWREKTATGADGRVGWRYALNFENPACFRAAMDWMNSLLRSHDWDGVNITELNFDAGFNNYLQPEKFVPMNAEVRAAFHKKAGFDPIKLFAADSEHYYRNNPSALHKFLRYREEIVTDWHKRVLTELEPLRRSRGFEVIVTALDSLHSNYVRPALGVDCRRIVELMKQFDFTLQVEDPAEHWNKPPDRYRRFAQTYLKLVPDPRRLMFDVNIMPDRDVANTFLPSATATGIELARTVLAASSVSGRAAIYSEHTIRAQDWNLLNIALTRPGMFEAARGEWKVDTPYPVLLSPSEDRDYFLDGQLWPALSSYGLMVPPGRHVVSTERPWWHVFEPAVLPAHIVSMTGDLLNCRANATGIDVQYASRGRNVVLFNAKPRDIYVDGHRIDAPLQPSGSNWATVLPAGHHIVSVVTNTKAGIFVNLCSWASSSAIAAFGGLATFMMIGIYLQLRFKRATRRGGDL